MEMVKNSPRDCYETVQKTTLVILQRLNQVLAMEQQIQSHSDRAQFHDLQGLLCATLQVNGFSKLHLKICRRYMISVLMVSNSDRVWISSC